MFRQACWDEPIIFRLGAEGRRGPTVPRVEEDIRRAVGDVETLAPRNMWRETLPQLPELSESQVARHYTRLSQMNYGVDLGLYPLGSCTMKYNPKVHEELASLPGFAGLHPLQPLEAVQGALALMYDLSLIHI